MITPTVTEIPRTMNPVSRDTFLVGAGASLPRREAATWPARVRNVAPAQRHAPALAVLAAQHHARSAHATTFAHAA